ncbi:MAG: hypothetical protein ACRDDZ_05510 [Marinifilaceae bacterium]
MSQGTTKLLLGIAIGAVAGVALGALLSSHKHEIKEGVNSAACKIKHEMEELTKRIKKELEQKGVDYLKRIEELTAEMARKADEYKRAVEADLEKNNRKEEPTT